MTQDSGERSEKATSQRMKEVRSKGKMSRSQDLAAWLGLGASALMVPGVMERAREAGAVHFAALGPLADQPDPEAAVALLAEALGSMATTVGPLFLVALVVVIAVSALQGGIRFRQFRLDPSNLNPVSGLARVFGFAALWQGAKALLKVAVIALVLWLVVQSLMPLLLQSGALPLSALLATGGQGAGWLIRASVAAGLVLAAADVLVVMRRNRKHTRMTRKELTDEHKRSEGDPLVKSQRRARQLALSRNAMIAAVADADVVIVNPTHVAVALRYQPGISAPSVVAKGAGDIATRLREAAAEHRVPMIRDIPLARGLHAQCDVGEEIPADSYTDVARVLAFVMKLKSRGASSGVHTAPAAGSGR